MSEIQAIHAGLPAQSLHLGGIFHVEHYRDGELIDTWDSKNVVMDEGINHSLNVIFNGAAQVTTWYVGIFGNNYTPVSTDTAASFPATAGEVTTQYSEGARPAYVEAASTAKSITNAANKAVFTAVSGFTAYGAFLASVATKGGTSGVLMAASRFSTIKTLAAGDQIVVTYTINGTSM